MLFTALIILGFVLLFAGGELLVRGAVGIGLRAGLTPTAVGLTIVALATSSPELTVSLSAAFDGAGGLALGNVVGSNICNIALILGLTGLIRPLRVEASLVRIDTPVVIGASLLLVGLAADGRIDRLDGAVLVTGLVAYVGFTLRAARAETAAIQAEFAAGVTPAGGTGPAGAPEGSLLADLLRVAAGIAALVAGGLAFLEGANGLTAAFGISPSIVGLSLAALGTSLPEIATSLVAALRGHDDIAVGNILGSNLFNILAIAGLTGVVSPFSRDAVSYVDFAVMVGLVVVLLPMVLTRHRIDRPEAGLLLAVYVGYLAWLAQAARP